MEFDLKINYADIQEIPESNTDDVKDSEKADMLKLMEKGDKQKAINKSSDNENADDNEDDKDREKIILIINRYKNS